MQVIGLRIWLAGRMRTVALTEPRRASIEVLPGVAAPTTISAPSVTVAPAPAPGSWSPPEIILAISGIVAVLALIVVNVCKMVGHPIEVMTKFENLRVARSARRTAGERQAPPTQTE